MSFSQQIFLLIIVEKAEVLLITPTIALFYSSAPVSNDSVTVIQHAQYQDTEVEAAKWNSAIVQFIIYCAFLSEKGLLLSVYFSMVWSLMLPSSMYSLTIQLRNHL